MPLIIITREFDAPRDLVFRAYTEPELLTQWLGGCDARITIERYDVRDGGRWRYLSQDAEGRVYGFRGVFHGAPSPDAIVQTFEYEGSPGQVSLDTYTFEDLGGMTMVRSVSSFQSVENRDRIVEQSMELGVRNSARQLADVLAKLQTSAT
ncbi:SRPBCC family protein [Actinopolymorpha alba]|uniref:SRPBCC family protein n=1 Tax=Actinopolymorpha alba TaxID=533267 RepID=UPI00192CA782|nr:SRPBCC family protein [Actinopolymorpha alba]